jgi:AhpD family alkylhydroperoxidase
LSDITSLHSSLIERVLEGEGGASPEIRRGAFENEGLAEPVRAFVDKVAHRARMVTDADIGTLKKAGLSEEWSVADRELMAAYVSKMNETEFCIAAHTATSALAYKDGAKLSATLADLETAPLTGPLRATLRMLGKLTRENNIDADDIRRALAAGASEQQIKDALAVALAFNVTDRLADVFDFAVNDPAAINAGAKYLLARGYR